MTTLLETEPTVRETGRSTQFSWVLADGVPHPDGVIPDEIGTLELTLGIYHHANSKQFTATVNMQLAVQEDGYSTTQYLPMDAIRVLARPVPRYSAKAQREFATEALAVARQAAAGGHLDKFLKHQATTDA